MTKYEVESFGQSMSARYVVYSDTDSEAMKLAEKHHRPYNTNFFRQKRPAAQWAGRFCSCGYYIRLR